MKTGFPAVTTIDRPDSGLVAIFRVHNTSSLKVSFDSFVVVSCLEINPAGPIGKRGETRDFRAEKHPWERALRHASAAWVTPAGARTHRARFDSAQPV